MRTRTMVFAPHPDDETLGCGGTIAKRLSENCEVSVVVLTDGRYAFLTLLGIDSEPTPGELKDIRNQEVKRAIKVLGVSEKNLLFLDFEDGKLEENEEQAQQKVTEILRRNNPSEVYFTSDKDFNPDHGATSRIVGKSLNELNLDVRKYQYTIARKFDRFGPIKDRAFNIFMRNMVCVDISKFLQVKEAALREYRSELTVISPRQQRPLMVNISKYLKPEEKFFISKQ